MFYVTTLYAVYTHNHARNHRHATNIDNKMGTNHSPVKSLQVYGTNRQSRGTE